MLSVFPALLTNISGVDCLTYVGTEGFRQVESSNHLHFVSLAGHSVLPSYLRFVRSTVAGFYVVRPHVSGFGLSAPSLFASLFILADIVRYKASFWVELLRGTQSGSAAIAESVCDLAARRLPNDALEHIWQERFIYASPGYFI